MQGSTLTIVTCWLGHPELQDDYTEAVQPELANGDRVIIIDNGDAPEFFQPGKVLTVVTGENRGFAKGSNDGLHLADTDAVLFLNNDIALGRRGWLEEIRELVEPGVLVGPLRTDHHAQVDGQPMPYLDGWCLAGMREDLLELGGFDEELEEPAYYSDNLLCLEARAAGMVLRELRSGLRHKLNVTAGSSSSPDVQAASAANRARYVARVRDYVGASV